MKAIETIQNALFNKEEHDLEFVTWTGEGNSFIIKQDGKEFRVEVIEELPTDIKISYDYQNLKETIPFSKEAITQVFKQFENDAGLIVDVKDKEFFFENMDEYEANILTCVSDSMWSKASREKFLEDLM